MTPSRPLPRIAITMGDPCGVGPEIIVRFFDSVESPRDFIPFVVGDATAFKRAIKLLDSKLTILPVQEIESIHSHIPGILPLFSPGMLTPADLKYGQPTPATCSFTILCIETAVKFTMSGTAQAVCTCPINKERLHLCGFPFPGHTEFIRDLTGADEVIMMLAGPRLRVSLVTIHEALAAVPKLITKDRLSTTIRITVDSMVRDFGFKKPRIAIAGLNPHAGEAGRFGREELKTIQPIVEEFRKADAGVSGPWPPDTIFHRALAGEFDAVVAMYHDQGLIPVKLAHFNVAVNISLGLPIVRTSVDHGTAYELAGTGKADPGSLKAAIYLASRLFSNRLKSGQAYR